MSRKMDFLAAKLERVQNRALWTLRRRLQGALLVASVFLSLSLSAEPESGRTLIVVSRKSPVYTEILGQLRNQLSELGYASSSVMFVGDEGKIDSVGGGYRLVITVGTLATKAVYQLQPEMPQLGVFLTRSAYSSLTREYYGSEESAQSRRVSAIFLDQPISRSIKLGQLLVPEAKSAGFMLGPVSEGLRTELEKEAGERALKADLVSITASDNPINKLEPVIANNDFFVPMPDNRLINLATARWILQLGYRHKKPVIAYSATYVEAGALAAVYSSPEDVVRQAGDVLREWSEGIPGAGVAYEPTFFSVKLNRSVAAALGIQLKDESYYRKQL